MGYSPNQRLLEENLSLLQDLLAHVKRGEILTLSYPPEVLGSAHFSLNRILHSAQLFHAFEQGKFVGLRSSLALKIDAVSSTIKAVPRTSPYTPVRRNCLDALEELKADESSSIRIMEFYPDSNFDPEEEDDLKRLFLQAAEIGWTLHVKAVIIEEEEDGGLISIGVERREIEESSGFDALRKHKTG